MSEVSYNTLVSATIDALQDCMAEDNSDRLNELYKKYDGDELSIASNGEVIGGWMMPSNLSETQRTFLTAAYDELDRIGLRAGPPAWLGSQDALVITCEVAVDDKRYIAPVTLSGQDVLTLSSAQIDDVARQRAREAHADILRRHKDDTGYDLITIPPLSKEAEAEARRSIEECRNRILAESKDRPSDPPPIQEVYRHPIAGDLLCFNGKRWCVARRDGWHYPVEEETPDERI